MILIGCARGTEELVRTYFRRSDPWRARMNALLRGVFQLTAHVVVDRIQLGKSHPRETGNVVGARLRKPHFRSRHKWTGKPIDVHFNNLLPIKDIKL